MIRRILLLAVASASIALADDPSAAMRASVSRLEQQAAKSPSPIAVEIELRAADALAQSHRDLAVELARHSLGTLRSSADKSLGAAARKQLEALLPGEAASIPQPAPAAAPQRSAAPPEVAAIQSSMRNLRGNLTDAERTKLDLDLARQIRALPAGPAKLSAARSLASLSTEGDLGAEALGAVAVALSTAMRENPSAASDSDYIELGSLVRYEHVATPPADPALDTTLAYLELRDLVTQEAGFNLTGLDGKAYSLAALKGKVVMVNFWATWCPPCRKEMPDMEKLYQRFQKQGLVILGISDEERDTVTKFLADKGYTYPILLDPGRNANTAFGVEGIPKTFVFDREGKLAAQSIDMRTEAQFLKLLKQAGME